MESQGPKNFTVDELKCPCCGIFAMKPAALEAIQQVRDLFGKPMIINSAYRCPKHNAEVMGHPNSEHIQGIAFDVKAPTAEERYRLVELAMSCSFRGIGVYSDRIHMDLRVGRKSMWMGGS